MKLIFYSKIIAVFCKNRMKHVSILCEEKLVLVFVNSTFKPQWSLYASPGFLTFKFYTFCPHGVFMWFMWISEQTAIFSVHSIN
jgi:hypothetical protein